MQARRVKLPNHGLAVAAPTLPPPQHLSCTPPSLPLYPFLSPVEILCIKLFS